MCSEYSDDDGSKILNGDVRVIDILELFSKENSNYCSNAKNREIWPQGLDLG